MKRVIFLTFAAVAVVFSTGCEQHDTAELPPHYQHKGGEHHDTHAAGDAHPAAGGHDKAPEHGATAPAHGTEAAAEKKH